MSGGARRCQVVACLLIHCDPIRAVSGSSRKRHAAPGCDHDDAEHRPTRPSTRTKGALQPKPRATPWVTGAIDEAIFPRSVQALKGRLNVADRYHSARPRTRCALGRPFRARPCARGSWSPRVDPGLRPGLWLTRTVGAPDCCAHAFTVDRSIAPHSGHLRAPSATASPANSYPHSMHRPRRRRRQRFTTPGVNSSSHHGAA